jgi:hypothetical protein
MNSILLHKTTTIEFSEENFLPLLLACGARAEALVNFF